LWRAPRLTAEVPRQSKVEDPRASVRSKDRDRGA
jgi:hypothetical protein